MEDIITKESEEKKYSGQNLEDSDIIKRKHYSFRIKVVVIIVYNSIVAFYSATFFPLFGVKLEIFYAKILFALIGEFIFCKIVNKWRDGKNYKFALYSVLVLFFSFIVGNSIDIILEHIIFKRLTYRTVSANYFIFIYTFMLEFIIIYVFNFYAKKMDSKEQTINFYIPILLKIGSFAFFFIFFVGSILISRSVYVEDRNAILTAGETIKTQMSMINNDIEKYLISVNETLQQNVSIIDRTFYENTAFDINTAKNNIESNLNIFDIQAGYPFSHISISVSGNYTLNKEPLYLVFDINSDGVINKNYYNTVLYNELRATNIKRLSNNLGFNSYIRYNNLKDGSFDLIFTKDITSHENNAGYISAVTSGIHLRNIVSKYIMEGLGKKYILYNMSDGAIYSSSADEYMGAQIETVNNTINWDLFLTLMKNNSGADIYMTNASVMFTKEKMIVVGAYIASINSTLLYIVPEEAILKESSKRKSIAFSIILAAMIIFVIIFSLMIRGIIDTITLATRSAETLKKGGGDLRQRIFTDSSDEIGILIFNFNEFISGLDSLIKNLKGESHKIHKEIMIMDDVVKESAKRVNDQTASITESVASINNIITSISNVGQSTSQQTHAFSSASIAIEELLQTIFKINENMEKQSAAVEETSASIEEMISNINSVAKSVNKADEFSKKLLNDARDGGDTVDEVIEAIHEIEESSDQIKEIINVIQGVAEQTNLLAMNAAIEAAHAGEQGKGFAVVADEIRSLAEHTSNNAKSVTLIIKDITKRVERTVDLALYSGKSLDNILDTSGNTARVISEINVANTELEVGGRDILETLKHLNDITYQVKENVKEQMNSGDVVDSQITLLDQITKEVSEAIEANTMGAKDIVDAMAFLNDLAEKTRQGNEGFSNAINRLNEDFKRFNALIENFITDDKDEKEIDTQNAITGEKTQKDLDIDNLMLKSSELDNSIMDKAAEESPVTEDDDIILKMLQDEFKNSDLFDKK